MDCGVVWETSNLMVLRSFVQPRNWGLPLAITRSLSYMCKLSDRVSFRSIMWICVGSSCLYAMKFQGEASGGRTTAACSWPSDFTAVSAATGVTAVARVTVIGDLKNPLVSWLTSWIMWSVTLCGIKSSTFGGYYHMWTDGSRAPDSISASAKLPRNSDCIFTFFGWNLCRLMQTMKPVQYFARLTFGFCILVVYRSSTKTAPC